MKVHLVFIGKNQDQDLSHFENQFLKRLTRFDLIVHQLKSSANVISKVNQIFQQHGQGKAILLSEHGKHFDSARFAAKFSDWEDNGCKNIVFIMGDSHGHDPEVIKHYPQQISLSQLTFPHKLARVVFIEQLYRVQSIIENHPYHH